MSRRPFRPDELDQPSGEADGPVAELQRYAGMTDADAPRGLSDRVMAAIQQRPAPRRGFLAWLGLPVSSTGGPGRSLRVAALAATLVLAVAGALYAGQLADLIRNVGSNGPPSPSVVPSPSETQSVSPVSSSSVEASPSSTPASSDDHGGSGAEPTAVPTPNGTPGATPVDTPEEAKTPRPSPTATASPTATPLQGS